MNTRVEADSIGTLEVPVDAYYGVQSLRGHQNFPITGHPMHELLIVSLAQIKKASAMANKHAGTLDAKIADAIIAASDEVINGKLHDQFIVDAIQGGAGTSANMNANEVIANRAIEILGGQKGDYSIVHPNDHVNMAQSTNDVYPTAGKLAILALLPGALQQLNRLYEALEIKAKEFDDVVKMGRTQLQDAVPIRLGQSFHAYASAIQRDIKRLHKASKDMCVVNMGATAIGTAINVSADYLDHIVDDLREVTKFPLIQSEDLIDGTQNLDGFVNVSGIIKTCAVTLSKMSNDLRLMSSGPRTGGNLLYRLRQRFYRAGALFPPCLFEKNGGRSWSGRWGRTGRQRVSGVLTRGRVQALSPKRKTSEKEGIENAQNLSAQEETEKQSPRLPQENVHRQWP